MPSLSSEFGRLKSVNSLLKSKARHFGVNKKREIGRLLYEISKREKISPVSVIRGINSCAIDRNGRGWHYQRLKEELLKLRFPQASLDREKLKPYLPALRLKSALVADTKKKGFYPERIFIEAGAWNSDLAVRLKRAFPKAIASEISSLKDYLKCNYRFNIDTYNKRRSRVFIVRQDYDFFKRCPRTKGALGCGYHIFNLGFGCIYDCTYCYLQEYANACGIIFPANLDRFFEGFPKYAKRGMRLGSGEFSDSLMLDEVSGYSAALIDFFKRYPDVTFEFKTKSAKVDNIIKQKHGGNIMVSWSLNPQNIIDENEFFTSNLKARLDVALRCARAGYRLGFHFDPVIYFRGWQRCYADLLERLFDKIRPGHIAWLSIGTLRASRQLKPIIEARFPGNKILDEELLLGFDGKLRYPRSLRYRLYQFLIHCIRQKSKVLPIYLCMEELSMWRDLNLRFSL